MIDKYFIPSHKVGKKKLDKRFSTMIQESAKSSVILIIGQMVSTLVSAIGAILIARILGSTSYGVISIANIPVSISMMLINNGVSNAIINYLVEARQEENEENIFSIILTGYIINVTIGLITTIGLYLLSGYLANQVFNRPEIGQLIKILSLTVLAQSIINISSSVLVGFEQMAQKSVISILYSAQRSIIGPSLVYLGYGVIGAAYGYSTPYIITGAVGLILVYFNLKRLTRTTILQVKHFRQIITYSYPLFFSNLLSSSLTQALNFILPFYVSASLIGNYSAAKSFTVLLSFFIVPVGTATFPLLTRLKPEDPVFEYVFQNIIKYQTMIAFPIATAVIALSVQMVQFLYGSDYPFTPLFLQIQMLNYLFVGFGDKISITLLNSQKKTRIILYRTLLYLVFGTPIGFYLIPKYGIIGLQATIIIVPEIGLLYTLWWLRKNMNVGVDFGNTFKILLSSIFAYSACTILLLIIDTSLLGQIIIGGGTLAATYVISILLIGALTKQNLTDIRGLLTRYQSIQRIIDPLFSLLTKLARKND